MFHQGALPSVPRSVQDPLTTGAVNVEGTLNVLLAARDEGVRRVIIASSSSVYGNTGTLPRFETQFPDPLSPYAVSKLAAERYAVSFARVYGLETVDAPLLQRLRPAEDPTSQYAAVVPRFIAAVDAGEPVSIYGDGEQATLITWPEASDAWAGPDVRVDDVVDVGEVAGLLAVAVDASGSPRRRRDEARDDRRILRDRVLARAEDVEVAQRHGLEAVDAR